MATLKLLVVSDDGAKFNSAGPTTDRLAFGVYTLAARGDKNQPRPGDDPHAVFDRACYVFLEAAGLYHQALRSRK